MAAAAAAAGGGTLVSVECSRCGEVLRQLTEQEYAGALKEYSLQTAVCDKCARPEDLTPLHISVPCNALTCTTWVAQWNSNGNYWCRRTTLSELCWLGHTNAPIKPIVIVIHDCGSGVVSPGEMTQETFGKLHQVCDVKYYNDGCMKTWNWMLYPRVHHYPIRSMVLQAEPPQSFTEVHTQRGIARVLRELPGFLLGILSGERALATLVCQYAGYAPRQGSVWLDTAEPFLETCRRESANSQEWLYCQKMTELALATTDDYCREIADRCKRDTLCDFDASPFIVLPPPDNSHALHSTKRRRLT